MLKMQARREEIETEQPLSIAAEISSGPVEVWRFKCAMASKTSESTHSKDERMSEEEL